MREFLLWASAFFVGGLLGTFLGHVLFSFFDPRLGPKRTGPPEDPSKTPQWIVANILASYSKRILAGEPLLKTLTREGNLDGGTRTTIVLQEEPLFSPEVRKWLQEQEQQ